MHTNTTTTKLLTAVATVAGLVALGTGGSPAGAAPPGPMTIISALGYDQPGPDGIHRIDWALPTGADGSVDTVEIERWDAGRTTKLATYVQDVDEYEPTRIIGPLPDGTTFQYRVRAHGADGWGDWSDWAATAVEVGQTHLRPFTDAESFVERQAGDFEAPFSLGDYGYWEARVGDTGEVTDFIDSLSQEFVRRNRAGVIRLYFAYFDRAPEPAGLDYWVDRRDAGTASLASISSFFSKSAEFTATYGGTTNAQFVTLVYQNVLDRDPEPAGLAYWKGRLDQGTITRGNLMLAFSESLEGKVQMTDRVVAADIYTTVMQEQPTNATVAYYASNLASGGTGGDVAVMLFGLDDYPEVGLYP
jgi:hypothetical protein